MKKKQKQKTNKQTNKQQSYNKNNNKEDLKKKNKTRRYKAKQNKKVNKKTTRKKSGKKKKEYKIARNAYINQPASITATSSFFSKTQTHTHTSPTCGRTHGFRFSHYFIPCLASSSPFSPPPPALSTSGGPFSFRLTLHTPSPPFSFYICYRAIKIHA